MSEVKDIVLPILQKMQTDMGALRGKVDGISENVLDVKEKLGSVEGLMTWHLGLTSEGRHAIEELQKSLKALEQRVARLETRS